MASDGTVKISTKLDSTEAQKAMSKFSSIAQKGLSGLKTAAKVTATAIGAVSTALVAAGGYAVNVGASFESGMSQVQAISSATADEMNRLTEKAKEMGAKTKFSASEAADAFTYMAMAGWKTEDMLGGIEGIMNLAAASGEDLASVSDIVTDALTAFGLQAEDSAHFADVLAKASSNSNTNVGMMGATFKYVAPIAGAMKYSIEDTAVAIGLMANAGIKGEQAGTSLRAMLTRLVKPPKDAAAALDALGISAENSDGTMKPLKDTMVELREKFTTLDDSQKAQYASSIAGQEAMSGLLAIVNASDEDFDKLTSAINDADGAALDMAETMQDNLQGKITILKSSLEGLGIEIYDSMESPLKSATEEGINYVNQITDAFKSDGLKGAVAAAGDIFAEIATKAAEQAPNMVNVAVDFIAAFGKGIYDNRKQLLNAAKNIVFTLANGLSDLLPKSIREPVKSAIKEIEKSFTSGGLKNAVNTISTLFKNIGNAVSKVTKTVLPPFIQVIDFAADNLNILIPLLVAGVAAYKSYTIVTSISKALSACTTNWTVGSVAVSVLTGKISLATAAQWLWNTAMNANPIGLLITAVGALAAGLVAYNLLSGDTVSAQECLDEANEELEESFGKLGESSKNFYDGINSAGTIFDNFNENIIVSNEKQQELAENMDSVQSEITDIARTATEERRGLTESEISRLDELFQQMRDLAAQELAIQEEYQAAVQDQAQVLAQSHDMSIDEYEEYAQTLINSAQQTKDQVISKAQEQYNEEVALLRQKYGDQATMSNQAYVDEINAAQENKNKAVQTATQQCAETLNTIQQGYLDRSSATQEFSGNMKKLREQEAAETDRYNKRVEELENNHKLRWDVQKSLLKDAEEEHKNNIAKIRSDNTKNMTDEQIRQTGVWMTMVSDAELYGADLTDEAKLTADGVIDGFNSMPEETRESMKNAMSPMLEEMEKSEPGLFSKASSIAGGILNRLRSSFDIHSPSKKTRKIFKQVMQGAELGIEDEEDNVLKKPDKLAQSLVDRFKNVDIGNAMMSMYEAIGNNHSRVAESVQSSITQRNVMAPSSRDQPKEDKKIVLKAEIHTHVDMDKREMAVAITPYVSEELAFGGA